MKNNAVCLLCLVTLLTAGCGDTKTSEPNSLKSEGVVSTSDEVTPPSAWNATDACSVIDKAAMASIIGKPVSETTLTLVHESDGTTAATSQCTYKLGEGAQASLMMRWSPIADNSEEAINLARNGMQETMKAFGKSLETIDGVGKAAFWADVAGQLNVFIGEDKFVIVSTPSGPAAKEQAISVARKLGA